MYTTSSSVVLQKSQGPRLSPRPGKNTVVAEPVRRGPSGDLLQMTSDAPNRRMEPAGGGRRTPALLQAFLHDGTSARKIGYVAMVSHGLMLCKSQKSETPLLTQPTQ